MGLFSKKQRERRRALDAEDKPAKAFSYHGKRSESRQNVDRYSVTGRSRTAKLRRLVGFTAFFALLAIFAYSLWLGLQPQINIKQSANVGYRSAENYQAGIQKIWSSTLMNRTKLSISTSSLKRQILETYPEIESVTIQIPLVGSKPVVTLTPAQSKLMLINDQGALLLVGSDGKALIDIQNAEFTGSNETIPNIIDESGIELNPGEYVLNSKQVDYLFDLHKGLKEAKVPARAITLPSVPNQVNVYLQDKTYYLKFDFQEDPLLGVGAYSAFVNELKQTGLKQPTEYVDIRTPEKIFYR